jgi:4-hydroxy-4-methyl-2-oxoglutarate aldolase
VRDVVKIEALRFPVFHAGSSPRPTTKSHRGELGAPVDIDAVTVRTGDLVVADADGIAVIPSSAVNDVLADVVGLERRESELVQLLQRGVTTLEALGLE